MIGLTLQQLNNNQVRAAESLGISRNTLRDRIDTLRDKVSLSRHSGVQYHQQLSRQYAAANISHTSSRKRLSSSVKAARVFESISISPTTLPLLKIGTTISDLVSSEQAR